MLPLVLQFSSTHHLVNDSPCGFIAFARFKLLLGRDNNYPYYGSYYKIINAKDNYLWFASKYVEGIMKLVGIVLSVQ